MWRIVASLLGLVSFAIVSAEVIALGTLAVRGRLDSSSVSAIGAILAGQSPEPTEASEPVVQTPQISATDVEDARSLHTLELNARADDLNLLKSLLTSEAERLREERATYERARKTFEAELEAVRARAIDEATEQTQLVVKAMPAADAIHYLLSIAEEDALRVVKGLPDRTVAKILQEFAEGTDEQRQRGQFLFEALSAARPETDLTEAARAALPQAPAGDTGG